MKRMANENRLPCNHARLIVPFVLLLAMGCRVEKPTAPVERPPLIFRSATPADSASGVYEPDGIDLTVTFRRVVEPGELPTSMIVPRPLAAGELLYGLNSDREVVVPGVAFDPDVNAYRWLLDGPDLLEPVMIHLYPITDRAHSPAMSGRLHISPVQGSISNTLVFLCGIHRSIEFASKFDTILGLPIEQMAITRAAQGQTTIHWRARDLEFRQKYFVLAIRDTNGDGVYDLDTDWWGYHKRFDTPQHPIFVPAGFPSISPLPGPDDEWKNVDIELHPPWTWTPVLVDGVLPSRPAQSTSEPGARPGVRSP